MLALPRNQSDLIASTILIDYAQSLRGVASSAPRLLGQLRDRLLRSGSVALVDNTLLCSPLFVNGWLGDDLLRQVYGDWNEPFEMSGERAPAPINILLRSQTMARSMVDFVYRQDGRLGTPVMQFGQMTSDEKYDDAIERNWLIRDHLARLSGERNDGAYGDPDARVAGWYADTLACLDPSGDLIVEPQLFLERLLKPYEESCRLIQSQAVYGAMLAAYDRLLEIPAQGRGVRLLAKTTVRPNSEHNGWLALQVPILQRLDRLRGEGQIDRDLYRLLRTAVVECYENEPSMRHSSIQSYVARAQREYEASYRGRGAVSVDEHDAYTACRHLGEIEARQQNRDRSPGYWDFIVWLHRQGERIKSTAYHDQYGGNIASEPDANWVRFDLADVVVSGAIRHDYLPDLGRLSRRSFEGLYHEMTHLRDPDGDASVDDETVRSLLAAVLPKPLSSLESSPLLRDLRGSVRPFLDNTLPVMAAEELLLRHEGTGPRVQILSAMANLGLNGAWFFGRPVLYKLTGRKDEPPEPTAFGG